MRLNIGTGRVLAAEKERALAVIDAAAGRARGRYITTSPGQEAIYQAKAAEAQAYKDADYPMPLDGSTYPYIAAEYAIYGETMTPQLFADMVLTLRETWLFKGAEIEGARITGKTAVTAATSNAAALAAAREATAALDSL